MKATVYQILKAEGVPLNSHESDLYALATDEARAIVCEHHAFPQNVTTFRSQLDGRLWLDIPFAYDPFWEAKANPAPVSGPFEI